MSPVVNIVLLITIVAHWDYHKTAAAVNINLAHRKSLFESPEGKKCLESTGFDPENQPDDSLDGMCFFKCVMQETQVLDENGEPNPENLKLLPDYFPKEKLEAVKYCLKIAGKIDTCEDIAKYYACSPFH